MSISKQKPCVKVKIFDGQKPRITTIKGKPARTLFALSKTRAKGITALEMSNTWALRLSEYISILRHNYNLSIETLKERHHDGWHGRYVLHTRVKILEKQNF